MEDLLVIKRRKGSSKWKMKVTKKKNKGYHSTDYNNAINIRDFKELATFLEDMKILFDAPVDKAVKEMNKSKMFWN